MNIMRKIFGYLKLLAKPCAPILHVFKPIWLPYGHVVRNVCDNALSIAVKSWLLSPFEK